jgi:glycosyltransferase involved in cell wall biosynthesis
MSATPSLDVVIPVYNEERDLAPNITKLRDFLVQSCPYRWRIVIANNASTDRTLEIAKALAEQYPGEVTYIHLEEKGRGRALKQAWLASTAMWCVIWTLISPPICATSCRWWSRSSPASTILRSALG